MVFIAPADHGCVFVYMVTHFTLLKPVVLDDLADLLNLICLRLAISARLDDNDLTYPSHSINMVAGINVLVKSKVNQIIAKGREFNVLVRLLSKQFGSEFIPLGHMAISNKTIS